MDSNRDSYKTSKFYQLSNLGLKTIFCYNIMSYSAMKQIYTNKYKNYFNKINLDKTEMFGAIVLGYCKQFGMSVSSNNIN